MDVALDVKRNSYFFWMNEIKREKLDIEKKRKIIIP